MLTKKKNKFTVPAKVLHTYPKTASFYLRIEAAVIKFLIGNGSNVVEERGASSSRLDGKSR